MIKIISTLLPVQSVKSFFTIKAIFSFNINKLQFWIVSKIITSTKHYFDCANVSKSQFKRVESTHLELLKLFMFKTRTVLKTGNTQIINKRTYSCP